MDIIRIDGCTRTIGESQGYIGLPLRDIKINDSVDGPGTPAMESAWGFSEAEAAMLAEGAPVILRVLGNVHPPVMLYVGSEPHPVFTDAARDVLKERARQIDNEGWTPEHDDRHVEGELAIAAADYALAAGTRQHWHADAYRNQETPVGDSHDGTPQWPWAQEWWKPKSPREDLVRAAALILAEIERIDRRASKVDV